MVELGTTRRALTLVGLAVGITLLSAPVQALADEVTTEPAAETPTAAAPADSTPAEAPPVDPEPEPTPAATDEPVAADEPTQLESARLPRVAAVDAPNIPPKPEFAEGWDSVNVGFHDRVFVLLDSVPAPDVEVYLVDPKSGEPEICDLWSGTQYYCNVARSWFDGAKTTSFTQTFELKFRYKGGSMDEFGPTTPMELTFQASGFSAPVDEIVPAGDVLTIQGSYDYGAFNMQIKWDLSFNGQPVVTDGFCEEDGGESTGFTCTYDSTARAQVTASALPTGPGGGLIRERLETDSGFVTINEIPFSFTVEDGVLTPTTPTTPTTPGGDPGDPSTAPRLAPVPFLSTPDDFTPGDDPVAAPPLTTTPEAVPTTPTPTSTTVPNPIDALPFLILAVLTFTLFTMIGVPGMGVAGRFAPGATRTGGGLTANGRWPATDAARTGAPIGLTGAIVEGADEAVENALRQHAAWGDRSFTWRAPGHRLLDPFFRAAPHRLAARWPMLARLVADSAHVRAAFGALWLALVGLGGALGLSAAISSGGRPLAPALGLVIAILAISVVDAAAGAAAVAVFTLYVLFSDGLNDGLTLANGLRGLLGLLALWFLVPLIAGAARPLRRLAAEGQSYAWDRFADAVIASLLSGWAVQGIVGSLGDLIGRDQAIVSHANLLALLTIGLVFGRYLLEELIAHGYPERLRTVVDDTEPPEQSVAVQARGVLVRAVLLAFFAWAFLGPCWQLWVGVAIFTFPQVLALAHSALPTFPAINLALPRGVLEVLFMVVVGAVLAYWLDGLSDEGQIDGIRTGFVILAIPGAVLELMAVLGGEPPEERWTWPRQLAGAAIVAVTAVLVVLVL